MLNKAKIAEVLKDYVKINLDEGGDPNDFGACLPDQLHEISWSRGENKQPDGFNVMQEEQHGGEGEGDQYWLVFSVTDLSDNTVKYARFEGWYASYHGHEFENGDDFSVVEPDIQPKRYWKNAADQT